MGRRLLLLCAAAAAACSPAAQAPSIRHLDRPGDIAFACVGTMTVGQTTQTVAVPPGACGPGSSVTDLDAGVITTPPDGGMDGGSGLILREMAMVVEPVRGDVAVANLATGGFVDSDKFAPGLNGVPVGRLPTSIATMPNGCYVAVANSGSCDLSLVNVVNAFLSNSNAVSFVDVHAGDGSRVLARPTAIATPPSLPGQTPSTCDAPSGVAFVAFPSCHLVARVDLATGNILDGIRYHESGPPEIVGSDVTCPVDCSDEVATARSLPQEGGDAGAGDIADAGPDGGSGLPEGLAQPMALELEPNGSRLYIGAQDSGTLLIVDLDGTGKPTAVSGLPLEGAGGITRLAATGVVAMGNRGTGGMFNFVYAIGKDQAIHVADVTPGRPARECETQADRRFLNDIRSFGRLSCLPVGDPTTPPRRADARGPGIRLPHGVLPLDVSFLRASVELGGDIPPQPQILNGVFALVTAIGPVISPSLGRGLLYFINVDDDNYDDLPKVPLFDTNEADIQLSVPHVLRDGNPNRRRMRDSCTEPTLSPEIGPARLDGDLVRQSGYVYNDTGQLGDLFAPSLHQVICDPGHTLFELSVNAPPEVRGPLFPDLGRIGLRGARPGTPTDEGIVVQWEGPLAFDRTSTARAGGRLTINGDGTMTFDMPGALLCAAGARAGDIINLTGCTADVDCAFGEICVVHPEAPSGVTGMCMPKEQAIDLTARCREILTSVRRYTAVSVWQDRATLVPRPRILNATPIDGCTSSEQCQAIEEEVLSRTEADGMLEQGSLPRYQYSCEVEPTIGGPPRCITVCTTDADCEPGTVCDGRRCVLGPVPPPECVSALQHYEPRAGDAFSIVSSQNMFKSRVVEGSDGQCVVDTTASPLLVKRFHRIEPPCTDTSLTGVSPNPCMLVDLMEPYPNGNTSGDLYSLRPAYGIRIRSPGLTVDVTDVGVPLMTVPDVLVSNIPYGYGFRMNIAAGFIPYTIELDSPFPQRIVTSPDGSVWVVDSGLASGTISRGQILNITQGGQLSTIRLL